MAFSFGKSPAPSTTFGAPAPTPTAAPAFGATQTATAPAPAPAFNFGGAPAPAPAFGAAPAPAFGAAPAPTSFGAAKAPAPSGGLFGNTAPAPAPSGGLFGNTAPAPAPSGGLFGSTTPAPAPSGGLFGASAPAPSGGLFGNTSQTSTTSSGGLFGNKPTTPAPAGGGLFGGKTPAPPTFGSTQTTSNLFGASTATSTPAPLFGNPPAGALTTMANDPSSSINGQTPYASLPAHYKKAIDDIHEKIWNHKRAMAQVSTMAPKLLRIPQAGEDAAGGESSSLSYQLDVLQKQAKELEIKLGACANDSIRLKNTYEASTTESIVHGIWPVEALAARKGVKLTSSSSQQKQTPTATQQQQGFQTQQQGAKSTPTMTITEQIRKSLELQATHVDRIEKIPSPYMWKTLEGMEGRLSLLKHKIQAVDVELQQRSKLNSLGLASLVQSQTDQLLRVSASISRLQTHTENLRKKYNAWERKSTNVLMQQKIKDLEGQQRQGELMKIAYLKAQPKNQIPMPPTAANSTGANAFGTTPASGGGLFGSKPATTGGLFGGAPTAAPAAGGLFGAPAPAPAAGGGLFGKAPAPGGGSLFGGQPAPAPALGAAPAASGLFGAKAPAPATGGSLFGTAAPPAPAGGNLFGNTSSPAAPAAPLFGSTATAPAPAFGATPAPAFGAAKTTTSSKPNKNKSRGGGRKR